LYQKGRQNVKTNPTGKSDIIWIIGLGRFGIAISSKSVDFDSKKEGF